ncbi:hypothetical protein CEXT_61111 [Caerostris extrusa]|uniref:Uncharacterized protein n=1 Tax=Caerostris extrusa TaxID=172846 RepID=A0AAV4SGC9_CAEEX|nr:hypothetical protein CEXT_61111 [Caerostris extrusa]
MEVNLLRECPLRRMARRLEGMQFHPAIISYYVLRRARTPVVKSVVAAAIIVYFCIQFYSSCEFRCEFNPLAGIESNGVAVGRW